MKQIYTSCTVTLHFTNHSEKYFATVKFVNGSHEADKVQYNGRDVECDVLEMELSGNPDFTGLSFTKYQK